MTSSFLLNNQTIHTDQPNGTILLDFIRYHKALTGTKVGCREGDCGACTILVGDLRDGALHYESMTSCLTPIANAHGKHIVTIEGLNGEGLSPVQQAVVDEGGTQCGFCTVGFIVSLHGFCLSEKEQSYENAIAAIDGNICRCTGYKSLERACGRITENLAEKDPKDQLNWLVKNNFLPEYFTQIKTKLQALQAALKTKRNKKQRGISVGGGTDLYVQLPEAMAQSKVNSFLQKDAYRYIRREGNQIHIGSATTAEDLQSSPELQAIFPRLREHIKLVSSTPIRNMGTLAGNFINASPIGDLTIFFLALDSTIILRQKKKERRLKLKDFYKGYKQLQKRKKEHLASIIFEIPNKNTHFNFEKVCKRTHLDIATVNTAIAIEVNEGTIQAAQVAIGGVGPIPTYLHMTSKFLVGKPITTETIQAANEVLQAEISPISDVRGSKEYKRLLARQLFYAHFVELFECDV